MIDAPTNGSALPPPTNGHVASSSQGKGKRKGRRAGFNRQQREWLWNAFQDRYEQQQEMVRNLSAFSRTWFQAVADPRRDLFAECGWPGNPAGGDGTGLSVDLYKLLYDREPLATRVVELMPKECWQQSPTVFEDMDTSVVTPFEEAWDRIGQSLRGESSYYQDETGSPIWDMLQRVDIVSGIGSFGVLLLGIDDGKNLQEPVDGVMVTNAKGEPCGDGPLTEGEEQRLLDPKPRWRAGVAGGDSQRQLFGPQRGLWVNEDRLGASPLSEGQKLLVNQWRREREQSWTLNAGGQYDRKNAKRDRGFHNDVNEPTTDRAKRSDGSSLFGGTVDPRDQSTTPYAAGRAGFDPTDPANPGPMRANDAVEVYGTDRQYDDIGYGLGMPPPAAELGYSLSGTDEQYFGVQFGPSEQPAPPTDPATAFAYGDGSSGRQSGQQQRGQEGSKRQQRPRPRLLFLRAYGEDLVQIVRYEWNIRNPRFGLPVMYRITLNDPSDQQGGVGLPLATVFVHWSRVIHVADNRRSSQVFGIPRLRPVINDILDAQKVAGAGAEGYYKSCFDADTKFFDGNTLKKLSECVGEQVMVTCADGNKHRATVQAFGERRFVRIALGLAKHSKGSRGKFMRFITATRDHRWMLADGRVTSMLKVGDVLAANHFPEREEPPFDAWGFAHGVVFGDGWIENKKFGTHQTAVKLFGEKNWMFDRLSQVSHLAHSGEDRPDGKPLLRFTNRETNMKALPVDGKHSEDYVYWFLQGWFATDGHNYKHSEGLIGLSTSKVAAVEWFLANAPFYGFEIIGYAANMSLESPGVGVQKRIRKNHPNYLIRCKKLRIGYEVKSIADEGQVGESYCVVEPETKTFTLEGGVVTGNCFTGLQFVTHPQLGGDVMLDEEGLRGQVNDYQNSLQRVLTSVGGSWQTIAPTVVDPTPHHNLAKERVCIHLGCPVPVFSGYEIGEQASENNSVEWNKRKYERQLNYLTPSVIVPLVDRLIQVRVLPVPGDAKQKVANVRRTQPWVRLSRGKGGWIVANWRKPSILKNAVPVSVGDLRSRQALQMQKDNQQRPAKAKDEQARTGQTGGPDGFSPDYAAVPDSIGPADPAWKAGNNGGGWRPPTASSGANGGAEPWEAGQTGVMPGQASTLFITDGGYSIEWPDVEALSKAAKAGIAVQYTQALAAYQQGGCEALMPFKDYLIQVWGWTDEQAQDMVDAAHQQHEDADTLGTPPMVEGHPQEAPDGSQAKADQQVQQDQADAKVEAMKHVAGLKAKQGGAAGGDAEEAGWEDAPVVPKPPSPTGNELTDNENANRDDHGRFARAASATVRGAKAVADATGATKTVEVGVAAVKKAHEALSPIAKVAAEKGAAKTRQAVKDWANPPGLRLGAELATGAIMGSVDSWVFGTCVADLTHEHPSIAAARIAVKAITIGGAWAYAKFRGLDEKPSKFIRETVVNLMLLVDNWNPDELRDSRGRWSKEDATKVMEHLEKSETGTVHTPASVQDATGVHFEKASDIILKAKKLGLVDSPDPKRPAKVVFRKDGKEGVQPQEPNNEVKAVGTDEKLLATASADKSVKHHFQDANAKDGKVSDHEAVGDLLDKEEMSSAHEEEIGQAVTLGDAHKQLVIKGNKIVSASAWSDRPEGTYLDHTGSLEKGGGTKALVGPVAHALKTKTPLVFQSTRDAEGFYDKLGFTRIGKSDDGEAKYKTGYKDLEQVASKLIERLNRDRS